jgi:3-dehydro-L-gulonate 2-dehydrogenase
MAELVRIPANEMLEVFHSILKAHGFEDGKAKLCAEIFTNNSIDGVYTHGVNRFARFVSNIDSGHVQPKNIPSLTKKISGLEQWDGNLGPGPSNAVYATDQALKLSTEYGIGCVAMANTNHWMRGGTYGWQAAKRGSIFIGWTNTIANMPAWGATDNRLGNNPIVIALPYKDEAIVLDMAMSQYSFGAMEMAEMKKETFPVFGGFDKKGELTKDPSAILQSRRPLPIGFWKGAGLSLLLDLLASILSGGWSTAEISKREVEYGLSQVFITINIQKLSHHTLVGDIIEGILADYLESIPEDDKTKITYPGQRVLYKRTENLTKGIPVLKNIWEHINKL